MALADEIGRRYANELQRHLAAAWAARRHR
jgi:hypothetical protein